MMAAPWDAEPERSLRTIDRKLTALLVVEATIAALLALGVACGLAAVAWLRRRGAR